MRLRAEFIPDHTGAILRKTNAIKDLEHCASESEGRGRVRHEKC